MAERRVPEVMHKSCGRRNILDIIDSRHYLVTCIDWEVDIDLVRRVCDGLYQPLRYACNFQRVCQACANKVIRIERKDLGLVFKTAYGAREHDSVVIPLILRTMIGGRYTPSP